MKLGRRGRWGALAAGLVLLIWGATSAFSDWKQLAALTPDALDNPESGGSQWVFLTNPVPAVSQPANPSLTPFQPGLGPDALGALPTSVPDGDSQIFSVPYSNTPAPTPEPIGMVPERIVIPDIHLDAPVDKVPYRLVKDDATGTVLQQWSVPNKFAAGWQGNSAMLGVKGNTVLDGHHNVYGEVFRYLIDLSPGQLVGILFWGYDLQSQISQTKCSSWSTTSRSTSGLRTHAGCCLPTMSALRW